MIVGRLYFGFSVKRRHHKREVGANLKDKRVQAYDPTQALSVNYDAHLNLKLLPKYMIVCSKRMFQFNVQIICSGQLYQFAAGSATS